ncbi:MAG: hypothetical protein V3T41_08440 [bacterium]
MEVFRAYTWVFWVEDKTADPELFPASGNGVRLQDQRLTPEGVVSTPAERIVNREIAAANGDNVHLGRGCG